MPLEVLQTLQHPYPSWGEKMGSENNFEVRSSKKHSDPNMPSTPICPRAAFQFELRSVEEQTEIVRRVEALFNIGKKVDERVATGTQRTEGVSHAVLAKAFRGELVATEAELTRREDRSYEPGGELLYRIKVSRESSVRLPTSRRAKNSVSA